MVEEKKEPVTGSETVTQPLEQPVTRGEEEKLVPGQQPAADAPKEHAMEKVPEEEKAHIVTKDVPAPGAAKDEPQPEPKTEATFTPAPAAATTEENVPKQPEAAAAPKPEEKKKQKEEPARKQQKEGLSRQAKIKIKRALQGELNKRLNVLNIAFFCVLAFYIGNVVLTYYLK